MFIQREIKDRKRKGIHDMLNEACWFNSKIPAGLALNGIEYGQRRKIRL